MDFQTKENILLFINDKDESKSLHSLEDVVVYSDFIFLSVPTPSNSDGSIDLSYVETTLQEMSEIYSELDMVESSRRKYYIIKNARNTGTTRKLQQKYQNLNLVFQSRIPNRK